MKAATTDYTEDTLFNGRLKCLQSRTGYRFSLDAILLANFIVPQPDDHILDLGAGCGVVALVLAYRWPHLRLTAVELQKSLADLCRKNVALNGYQERITMLNGDMRRIDELISVGSFDWAVVNPPYRKMASGRVNPDSEQAQARHELKTDLNQVVGAVVFAIRTRGRAAFIYPAGRGAALIQALKSQGLEPKRMQTVYSYPGDEGRLLLVEALKGGGEGLTILPPFYVYKEAGGDYSPEMARCYEV